MEICELSEAFVEQDGDLVFDHSKIILRRGEEYFYATPRYRLHASSIVNPNELELIQIPVHNIWPRFDAEFTRAPEPRPSNCYIKQPSLLHYGETAASLNTSEQVLNEVKVCEVLRRCPHPNIARYLGCIVDRSRIKGLCFEKYPMTLPQRLEHGGQFDEQSCLQGIKEGVMHLHGLGLIHNDLKPSNIMIDREDNPIIIDFDSCQSEGERLGLKAGTRGWAIEGSTIARRENDYHGIAKIDEFLKATKQS